MRLSSFLPLVRLVSVLRAELESSPKEIDLDVIKIWGMLNIEQGDFYHLDEDHISKRILTHMSEARESLADSWKDGSVDPKANFETLHPDITAQSKGPLCTISPVKWHTASRERAATLEAMRQAFICEKEFAHSVRAKEQDRLQNKMIQWCKHLVDATRHQVEARNAGGGKMDLRILSKREYQEACEANYRESERLRDRQRWGGDMSSLDRV